MLRVRLVVPVVVFALSAMATVLPSVTSAAGDAVAVSIHDGGDVSTWGYGPDSTTVAVGQTVTWTNSGTSPHDATSTDGSWKTPLLTSGASATVTFSTAGTYAYSCVLHPWMRGTVVVTPAASAPAPAPSTVDASAPNSATVSAPAPAPSTVDVTHASAPDVQGDVTATQADDNTIIDISSGGDD
jgi:plastocyanin